MTTSACLSYELYDKKTKKEEIILSHLNKTIIDPFHSINLKTGTMAK